MSTEALLLKQNSAFHSTPEHITNIALRSTPFASITSPSPGINDVHVTVGAVKCGAPGAGPGSEDGLRVKNQILHICMENKPLSCKLSIINLFEPSAIIVFLLLWFVSFFLFFFKARRVQSSFCFLSR